MKLQQTVAGFFPRALLRILATSLPVALCCNYVAQMKDVHPAQETMTPAAVAARLAPVARVLPVPADAKIASGYAVVSTTN